MDLRELGALLKAERERRGLSDNDVIDRIKIGRACLVAIEEGDKEGLPHPVYAKGFIKNYAKLLDLDPEEVGEAFAEAVGVIPDSHLALQHELNESVTQATIIRNGGRGYLRYVIVAAVILVVVAAVLWFFSLTPFNAGRTTLPAPSSRASSSDLAKGALPDQDSQPKPGSTADSQAVTASSETTPSTAVPESMTPTAPVVGQPASSQPLPVSPPGTPPALTTDPAVPTAEAASAADAEEPADPSLSPDIVLGEHGAHSVTILALAECWIDVSVDGGITKGIMLAKGKRFVGNFNESLLVRLGNAGGVEVRYDDKNYPLQAGSGEVKTLKFVAKGNGDPQQPASNSPTTQVPLTAKPSVGAPAAPAGSPPGKAVPGAVAPPSAVTVAPPAAPPVASSPAPAATPPAEGAAAGPVGSRSLEITGADGSWVIVTVDGGKPKEVFVKKGQTLTEPYKEKIEVRLGNPSSVVFRHDGQEMPVSTQRGEVKTVRFPNS
jgi:cytoskeleton protein RodZ